MIDFNDSEQKRAFDAKLEHDQGHPAVPSVPQTGAVGDQQWIAVTERLPRPGQLVLSWAPDANGEQYNLDFVSNEWAEWTSDEPVTHWMSLPQPPQGRKLPERPPAASGNDEAGTDSMNQQGELS